ncbi:MAG: hypothetical protein GY835_01965 [bacterium]|nr:hypothetical protein [bacterium]
MPNVTENLLPRIAGNIPILLILAVALNTLIVAVPDEVVAQDLPSVRFGTHLQSVVEATTTLAVPLVISQPPAETLNVNIFIEEGTATMGLDFLGGMSTATFEPGGAAVVYADIQIFGDTEIEEMETINLYIQHGDQRYRIGSIASSVVVIIDNDTESLTAHFELEDGAPLDPFGRIVVAVEPDVILAVDVVVDELPEGGGPVNIMTNTETGLYTLTFTDNPRQTFEIVTASIPEGETYALLEMQILNQGRGRVLTSVDFAAGSIVVTPDLSRCLSCYISYALAVLGTTDCFAPLDCGLTCPDEEPPPPSEPPAAPRIAIDPANDFETLRRYRDEILLGTASGDYCIQLYEDQSVATMTAILQKPTTIHRVAEVWELWLPAFAALVDNTGADFTITGEMQEALLGVMAELEEVGNPELARLVSDIRSNLDLENIAGQTADVLQTRIENDITPTEPTDWGELKVRFR